MNYRKSLLLLAFTSTAISCAKTKEDPAPAPPTRTQLLTAKKWQIRSATIEGSGQPTVDLYPLIAPCSRDDFEQFNLPNTYVTDEGPTKCSPSDPQTQLGIWALTANDTQLTVTATGTSTTSTIEELTDTSLKLTTLQPQSNGTNATVRTAFVSIK